MKIRTRYFTLVAFFIFVVQLSAQELSVTKYDRVTKAQAIENEIQTFIRENFNKYDLTPARIEEIRNNIIRDEKITHETKNILSEILVSTKKTELRDLYFSQYPEAKSLFSIAPIDIRYICDNGGLEEGYSDDYEFSYGFVSGINDCTIDTALLPQASLPTNDFTANATLVDNNVNIAGGFEPTLHLLSPPINLPRVNSGNFAVKLNNTARTTTTTMNKIFLVNSSVISYSYFFIAEHSSDPAFRPHFIVTLYNNTTGEQIEQNCIEADITNTQMFSNVVNGSETLLYTGWDCGIISLEGLGYGTEARIEFTVESSADGLSVGTVYIDDICTGGDCNPRYGKLVLNVNEAKCEPLPLNVCGIYSLPHTNNTNPVLYGIVNNLTLNIKEGDGVTPVSIITQTFANPVITQINETDYQFCFTIDQSDLGTPIQDDYEFEVVATYTAGGYTYTQSDASVITGPDLDFSNCFEGEDCTPWLIITIDPSATDEQQAKEWINASNTINSGITAIYHAGREVLLQDDFLAINESVGHFYIEGCTNEYIARPAAPSSRFGYVNTIDLIATSSISNNLRIYPNPASNELNIISETGKIKALKLLSLEGKLVMQQHSKTSIDNHLDISSIANGIYILTIELIDGEIISHKVIKE